MGLPPTLVGALATHARGRTLALCVEAVAGALPAAGTALAFAKEFQENPVLANELVVWTERPGRLLVLVPPFASAPARLPVEWDARRTDALAGGETQLGALLARERQHELRGALLPLERGGGQTITGGWRRHPAAGLLAITALPIWSLHTLEHRSELKRWLDQLLESAGAPIVSEPDLGPPAAELSLDDWALLLHLCRGPFADAPGALASFSQEGLQRLSADDAGAVLRSLEKQGFASGGQLTERGAALLDGSPYAVYAHELRSIAHG